MGQEQSQEMVDPNTPPHVLKSRTIEGVAEYIKRKRPMRIAVMTGAGISTSAGIPDFRSPDTGLYANLARLDLPHAEAVFDISYFRQNPNPFYVLAKELYPGKFYPTITHSFIALLAKKSMLDMLFTQNIDTLETRAGVPRDKIVEAHGSFATQRCIECKTEHPDDLMKKAVEVGEVPHCLVPQCNGLVKPDIVFFGESLPEAFNTNFYRSASADLVIVMGTSLTVAPFSRLPENANESVPRVLINRDRVGSFGTRLDDVLILEDCDTGVRKLADALGWRDELEAMWHEVSGRFKEKEAAKLAAKQAAMTQDELLEEEIRKLTADVDESLKLSKEHEERIIKQLEKASTPPSTVTKSTSAVEEKAAGVNLGSSSNAVSVPTAGRNEKDKQASSLSPTIETSPLTTEKLDEESPAQAPQIDNKTIKDASLPHIEPDPMAPEFSVNEKASSHI